MEGDMDGSMSSCVGGGMRGYEFVERGWEGGKRLLPASGRWSHSLPRFKLMRRLRRRNHEWASGGDEFARGR